MAEKCLNDTGLSYFWGKIKALINSKADKAQFASGYLTVSNVEASSHKDEAVTFSTPFAGTPQVVVGLSSSLIAYNTGNVSVSAMSPSSTGFTVRVYNASTAEKNILVTWIAIYN